MGHGDERAGHVVDHGQALVVCDEAQAHQRLVQHPLALQQHDPRRGAHQERRPERHQHQQQEPAGAVRRRLGDEVRQRIAQRQAEQRHPQTHHQRAPEQADVDALLGCPHHHGAIDVAVQVQRLQVVLGGDALAGAADGAPNGRFSPRWVDLDERRPPAAGRCAIRADAFFRRQCRQPAGAARDDAAGAALDAVYPARHLAHRACGAGTHQFARGRVEGRVWRQALAIPLGKRRQGAGQGVRHRGVIDAARQHRAEGGDERDPDEREQWQGEAAGAPTGCATPRRWVCGCLCHQRASHAAKRSSASSP